MSRLNQVQSQYFTSKSCAISLGKSRARNKCGPTHGRHAASRQPCRQRFAQQTWQTATAGAGSNYSEPQSHLQVTQYPSNLGPRVSSTGFLDSPSLWVSTDFTSHTTPQTGRHSVDRILSFSSACSVAKMEIPNFSGGIGIKEERRIINLMFQVRSTANCPQITQGSRPGSSDSVGCRSRTLQALVAGSFCAQDQAMENLLLKGRRSSRVATQYRYPPLGCVAFDTLSG